MNKIELEIVALQSSVTHMHSYAVVLGEKDGNRRIPIVIGGFEAQAIAVALENLQPKRPLTHDLLTIMFDTFDIILEEVLIYRLEEGIFYAKLVCIKNSETTTIDCRTSDALAIAIRKECPIYAYESILDNAAIDFSDATSILPDIDTDEDYNDDIVPPTDDMNLADKTIEELEKMLEEVLELEDYNKAIKIRDELNNRKK